MIENDCAAISRLASENINANFLEEVRITPVKPHK